MHIPGEKLSLRQNLDANYNFRKIFLLYMTHAIP